jgi:hypothetical protein
MIKKHTPVVITKNGKKGHIVGTPSLGSDLYKVKLDSSDGGGKIVYHKEKELRPV